MAIGNMPDRNAPIGSRSVAYLARLFCMWLYFPVAVARNVFARRTRTPPSIPVAWSGVESVSEYSARLLCLLLLPAKAGESRRTQARAQRLFALWRSGAGLRRDHSRQELPASLHGGCWDRVGQHLSMPYSVLAGSCPRSILAFTWAYSTFYRAAGDHRLVGLRLGDESCTAQQSASGGDRWRRLHGIGCPADAESRGSRRGGH